MALTFNDISKFLFKKLLGVSSTDKNREFFEEPYPGKQPVMAQDVWNESSLIPTTASPMLMNDNDVDGVVKIRKDLILVAVPGTSGAFYSPELVDAIPFNYGDGSYNYIIKNSLNQIIPFGLGDWIVDTASGVLTFYGTVPPNMPPKITFYKYIGTKGVGTENLFGTKKKIGPTESITNPQDFQYFIYGTMEIQGSFTNDGEVVVNTLYINNGTFINNGDLTII